MELQWRDHEWGPKNPRKRVWEVGWAGDQFEVMDYDKFLELEKCVKWMTSLGFNITLTEAEDN